MENLKDAFPAAVIQGPRRWSGPGRPTFGDSRTSWLVDWFGLNGSLRQNFSLYRDVSQREGERREK